MAFDEMADLLEAIELLEGRLSRDPEGELELLQGKVAELGADVGHLEAELLGFLQTRGDYETPDKSDEAIQGFYETNNVMIEALNIRREALRVLTMECRALEGRIVSVKRLRERVQELRGHPPRKS